MGRVHVSLVLLLFGVALSACEGRLALTPTGVPQPGASNNQTTPVNPTDPTIPVDPVNPDDPPLSPDAALQPIRRISSVQYDNVIRDLLGEQAYAIAAPRSIFPETAVDKHVFINDADANTVNTNESGLIEDNAEVMAEALLAEAQTMLPVLMPCAPANFTDADVDGCIDAFITEFGQRAHRRTLTDGERQLARGVYDTVRAEQDARSAWSAVVQLFLMSPALLYRAERGSGALADHPSLVRITGYEMASRLSFFLLNSSPDDALYAAAAAGELETPEQVRAQAERLIEAHPARVADTLAEFHKDWLYTRKVSTEARSNPVFTTEAREALGREMRAVVEHVFTSSDPTYRHLMTLDTFPVDPALGELYGVPEADGTARQVPRRRGLLTLASFNTAHARDGETTTILRGHFLLTDVLCGVVPLPGADVDIQGPLESTAGEPTARLRQAPLLERTDCLGCHVSFSPLGLALENYDDVGMWRDQENGVTIDASGSLKQGDAMGEFQDAFEMADIIASSERGMTCYTRQWFRFTNGRLETQDDLPSLQHLATTFVAAGGDLRALLVEMTQTPAFLYRRAGAQ